MSIFHIARFLELTSLLTNELSQTQTQFEQKLGQKELSCLKIVEHFGPISMNNLALYLHVSKSRTTQLVNKLEDGDYVRRIASKDKRSALVQIEQKGQRLLAEYRKTFIKLAKDISLQLENKELQEFERIIQKVELRLHR